MKFLLEPTRVFHSSAATGAGLAMAAVCMGSFAENDAAQGDDRPTERGGAEGLGRRPGLKTSSRRSGTCRLRDAARLRSGPKRWGCESTRCCSAGARQRRRRGVADSVARMETACGPRKAYGAEHLLWCPAVGGMPVPEAWEFDIRFDEKTGHVKQVVAGDNAPYQAYIEAHNHAVDTSREPSSG